VQCTEMHRDVQLCNATSRESENIPALEAFLTPAGLRTPRRADDCPENMALLVLNDSAGRAAAYGSPIYINYRLSDRFPHAAEPMRYGSSVNPMPRCHHLCACNAVPPEAGSAQVAFCRPPLSSRRTRSLEARGAKPLQPSQRSVRTDRVAPASA
jgi:hypothetical protein